MKHSDIIHLAIPFLYQVADQMKSLGWISRSHCVRALDLLLNTSAGTAFAWFRCPVEVRKDFDIVGTS